ncbi:hypothetical protein [uncultured Faecalibaculum sp.]|uniref:hypothetical protein n=1 Tax=uncultured Faecalibaculum sp. TaxID=1729681 RepID=UPI0025DD2196|nr:hypothetical protein [uncultured Faecalibaculum sp.]
MTDKYSVYSDFDVQKHKKHFVDYLEVIIHPDGSVHYAVPSHQEYLIRYLCRKRRITREQLAQRCPRSYYGDFMTWLCMQSGCLCVWSSLIRGVSLTHAQVKTLDKLKAEGVLHLDMTDPDPYRFREERNACAY